MEPKEQLYEGKAKKVFTTDDPELLIVAYKDDATAFNGLKKGTIVGKGVINNKMSNRLMAMLEKNGIPTHFVKELSDRETLVKKVQIVPLEVIVRNISAGSFAKHYGVEEGIVFEHPTIEFSYKNDALGDPLLNTYHALALKLATPEEIKTIEDYSFRINEALKAFWLTCGVTLVDFKLEFGRLSDGTIVLADEISPDTSRLWDVKTHEKLDKDRFRRDLGGVEEAYAEIMRRLEEHLKQEQRKPLETPAGEKAHRSFRAYRKDTKRHNICNKIGGSHYGKLRNRWHQLGRRGQGPDGRPADPGL